MFLVNRKNFATKLKLVVISCSLALLAGCFDDDHKKASHSSSSSSSSSSSFSSSLSSTSSSSSSSVEAPFTGEWYAPAYGYVLAINDEHGSYARKTYSITKNYCLLQDVKIDMSLDNIKQNYRYTNSSGEKLFQDNGQHSPAIEYKKLNALPDVCKDNLQTLKGDVAYKFDAKKDFDIFWQTFNELYVNFDVRRVNWNEVYDKAITSINDVKNEEELFEFISTLTEPLGDAHAIVLKAPLSQDLFGSLSAALANNDTLLLSGATQETLYQKLINEYRQTLEPGSDLTPAQTAAARDYFVTNYNQIMEIIFGYADKNVAVKTRAKDKIAWFKTSDNIGYLFIGSMSDFTEGESPILDDRTSDVAIAETTMNEALKDLGDTKGLIVDVRFNDGGHDEVSLAFVRHFINQPHVVYSKFAGKGASITPAKNIVLEPSPENTYLKPTAVLVSGDTVSAAEVFTIAMLPLPQVAIVGEQTAGAFSDIQIKRLTSDIAFSLSTETYLDVQGNNYEGIGIPPDIAVAFATPQERKGGYDGGMDKAMEWIRSKQ